MPSVNSAVFKVLEICRWSERSLMQFINNNGLQNNTLWYSTFDNIDNYERTSNALDK
jgi:hypothetical protein